MPVKKEPDMADEKTPEPKDPKDRGWIGPTSILVILLVAVVALAVGATIHDYHAQRTAKARVLSEDAIVSRLTPWAAREFAELATGGYLVSTRDDDTLRPILACLSGPDGQMNTYFGEWDGARVRDRDLRRTRDPELAARCAVVVARG